MGRVGKSDQPAHCVGGAQRERQALGEAAGLASGEGLQGSAGFLRGAQEGRQAWVAEGDRPPEGKKPAATETPLPAPSGGSTETPVLLAVHPGVDTRLPSDVPSRGPLTMTGAGGGCWV